MDAQPAPSTAAPRKRPVAVTINGVPRHQLPRLRPRDIQALRNVSESTEYRIRGLKGFPARRRLRRL